jgi:hypothetical protein
VKLEPAHRIARQENSGFGNLAERTRKDSLFNRKIGSVERSTIRLSGSISA